VANSLRFSCNGRVGFIVWLDGVVITTKSLSNDQTVGETSHAKRKAGCCGEKMSWCRSVRCGAHVFQRHATKREREEHKDQPCPARRTNGVLITALHVR
jgi:hypothetical protein